MRHLVKNKFEVCSIASQYIAVEKCVRHILLRLATNPTERQVSGLKFLSTLETDGSNIEILPWEYVKVVCADICSPRHSCSSKIGGILCAWALHGAPEMNRVAPKWADIILHSYIFWGKRALSDDPSDVLHKARRARFRVWVLARCFKALRSYRHRWGCVRLELALTRHAAPFWRKHSASCIKIDIWPRALGFSYFWKSSNIKFVLVK